MLDFYLIHSDQPKPDWPEKANLVHAGSVEMRRFDNLHKKGLIEARFDYHTDFRWSNAYLKQMYDSLHSAHLQNDTDVKAFALILEKALAAKSGLIAYAD